MNNNNSLTEENLDSINNENKCLTDKLQSIRPKDSVSNINSIYEEEDINSSMVSTTHKSGSLKSVGASYYSYLTTVEKKLKEERDKGKNLINEINKLKKKNC